MWPTEKKSGGERRGGVKSVFVVTPNFWNLSPIEPQIQLNYSKSKILLFVYRQKNFYLI